MLCSSWKISRNASKLHLVNSTGRRFLNLLGVHRQDTNDSTQFQTLGNQSGDKEEGTKLLILKASLEFVPQHGWSREAVAAGAVKAGLPPTTHGLFRHAGSELVHYFISTSNESIAQKLMAEVQQEDNQSNKMKMGERIRSAVQARLQLVAPYVDTWPQAIALMALPQNAPKALKSLGVLVDDIWYYAGDRSVDFNWYTKRVSLAAVYSSTELHMIQDKSSDFEDTWTFLDRRLDNVSQLGRCFGQLRDGRSQVTEISRALSQIMMNTLEINVRRH